MFTYLYVWANWLLQHSALALTHEDPALSRFSGPGFTPLFICTTLPGQTAIAADVWPVSVNSVSRLQIKSNPDDAGGGAMLIWFPVPLLVLFFWKHLIMILLYGRSDLFCNIWVTEEVHAVHLMRWSTVYCRVGYGNTLRLSLVLKQSQSLTRNTGGVLTENVLVWLITYSSFSAAYYRLLYRSSVSHSLANQF